MDIGTIRGLITLALLIAFVALVVYVYGKRRKAEFDEMARMPLEEDPPAEDRGSNTP
jgi:cytochrome c oxidase cbb3-type subunit IV